MADWENTGRAFGLIFGLATISAMVTAFLVVGSAVYVQDPGTALISSDKFFLLYLIPLIFFASIISIIVYTKVMQEKIRWIY